MFNYENLSVEELLKILILERNGEYIAKELATSFKSLEDLIIYSEENDLMNIKGIGTKRVQQLKAIAEIGRRLYTKSYINSNYKICNPSDVADLLMTDMLYLQQEVLKVILLNTKNIVIDVVTVSIGSLNSSIVHPRETFSPAIKRGAASIIVAHNHPSGDPTPSGEDVNITKRLKECGKILGIELLDHIIIGKHKYISLKERGIL